MEANVRADILNLDLRPSILFLSVPCFYNSPCQRPNLQDIAFSELCVWRPNVPLSK